LDLELERGAVAAEGAQDALEAGALERERGRGQARRKRRSVVVGVGVGVGLVRGG